MPEEPIGNERIVLVHGAMHGAWCWEKIVPLLAARGRRVVAIDLPGLGDDPADPDTVTFEDYVNRIVETVEAERVFMGGHGDVSCNRSGGMARLLSAARTPRK